MSHTILTGIMIIQSKGKEIILIMILKAVKYISSPAAEDELLQFLEAERGKILTANLGKERNLFLP